MLLCACASSGPAGGSKFILLSSTIGPIDAGIVGALETAFEKETGIRVRHVGAGTGAALDIAKKGNVDLVLVHAKSLEEKFVAEGFGTERIDLMYNDFVIMGPSKDPAGIKGMTSRDGGPEEDRRKAGALCQPRGQFRYPRGRDGAMAEGRDQAFRRLVQRLRKRVRREMSRPCSIRTRRRPTR